MGDGGGGGGGRRSEDMEKRADSRTAAVGEQLSAALQIMVQANTVPSTGLRTASYGAARKLFEHLAAEQAEAWRSDAERQRGYGLIEAVLFPGSGSTGTGTGTEHLGEAARLARAACVRAVVALGWPGVGSMVRDRLSAEVGTERSAAVRRELEAALQQC